jgi:thermitase
MNLMHALARSLAVAGVLGLVLAQPVRALAVSPASRWPTIAALEYVPGEVLVKHKPTVTARQAEASVVSRGHSVLARLGQPGWLHVAIGAQRVEDALAAYRRDPTVEYAQPNYLYRVAEVPDDPRYGQLWGFENSGQTITSDFTQPPGSSVLYSSGNPGIAGDDVDVEKAWDHVTDCSAVVVAVVDTGVNYLHEDLAANMWNGGSRYPLHGWNDVDDNDDPMDLNGHGTHVAGIIGAVGDNGRGATGVCWKASIMAVRVLDASGTGSTATIAKGVQFAADHGAKVINMSLGGPEFDRAFSESVNYAQSQDVVVVVAAGNSGTDDDGGSSFYPCSFTQPNIVCVAALDQSYALARFSSYGRASVDVGAPGANILSTWAGTNTLITDPMSAGWSHSSTTGAGWVQSTIPISDQTGQTANVDALIDPSTWPSGSYRSRTDDRAYKPFNLVGASSASVQFLATVDVADGDHFRVACDSAGGDPFAGTGVVLLDQTGMTTFPNLLFFSADVTPCISETSSIGFQLRSAGGSAGGVAIAKFGVEVLNLDTTSYNTISGTSMATPEVAGLATMLRAFNPQYTYADVVSAIEKAGRPIWSLSGLTATGNAIDVMSSLAYIHPPTGLRALVQ